MNQNTIKTTVAADHHGATRWCGATRPGRMHDLTAARVEGIDALLDAYPKLTSYANLKKLLERDR